jgi:hypothetical protein
MEWYWHEEDTVSKLQQKLCFYNLVAITSTNSVIQEGKVKTRVYYGFKSIRYKGSWISVLFHRINNNIFYYKKRRLCLEFI